MWCIDLCVVRRQGGNAWSGQRDYELRAVDRVGMDRQSPRSYKSCVPGILPCVRDDHGLRTRARPHAPATEAPSPGDVARRGAHASQLTGPCPDVHLHLQGGTIMRVFKIRTHD